MINWAFRNRLTGKITIFQAPNAILWAFVAATILRLAIRPAGRAGTALAGVGGAALILWAVDEIVRGVNPWRRALGGGVLGWLVIGLLSH
ncbi:MAG: hypothetical protein M3N98_08260 [Actinomycetota bacterium]|nr:hypothetical protein [Actinomycetota bacterium]